MLAGDALTSAIAGIEYAFTVTLYDSGNNRLPAGGDSIEVLITPSSGILIETIDNKDGSYTVQYMIGTGGQDYSLNVIINDESANSKSSTITVVPNEPISGLSKISFNSIVQIEIDEAVVVNIFD